MTERFYVIYGGNYGDGGGLWIVLSIFTKFEKLNMKGGGSNARSIWILVVASSCTR